MSHSHEEMYHNVFGLGANSPIGAYNRFLLSKNFGNQEYRQSSGATRTHTGNAEAAGSV